MATFLAFVICSHLELKRHLFDTFEITIRLFHSPNNLGIKVFNLGDIYLSNPLNRYSSHRNPWCLEINNSSKKFNCLKHLL